MSPVTVSAHIAELPASLDVGEDRARVGKTAVVVLDGASGTGCHVSVNDYVDFLADCLIEVLDDNPTVSLDRAVSDTIGLTAAALGLTTGGGPSSTVSIVRRGTNTVDTLVLGDSPIYVATGSGRVDRLSDDRVSRLDLPSRSLLFERLAAGHGYDDRHRALARRMSREKAQRMNRSGGYWIAEADPRAGMNAVVRSYPLCDVSWCVMLTDGAAEPALHFGVTTERLAKKDEAGLRESLLHMHRWETETDPYGKHLPRFKQHDDKTIAVVRFHDEDTR